MPATESQDARFRLEAVVSADVHGTPAQDEDQACALTLAALLFSTAKRERADTGRRQ